MRDSRSVTDFLKDLHSDESNRYYMSENIKGGVLQVVCVYVQIGFQSQVKRLDMN
jgi:hypothetical protein